MIKIKATKAGVEFLSNAEEATKVLAQKLGESASDSLIKSSVKLLSKTENGTTEVETDSLIKEATFLILNKLAEAVEAPLDNTNHLATVHGTTDSKNGEIKTEEYKTDSLAKAHAGENTETSEEQVGDVTEETPTHLGGIKLENEEENN